MKHIFNIKNVAAFLTLILLIGTVESFAQNKKPVLKRKQVAKKTVYKTPVYAVEAGTTMRARMNETIDSKSVRVGDTFNATITEPVYSTNGVIVIPVGSTVTGRVDTVKKAGNSGKPGEIGVSFTNLGLPNGKTRAINGSLTDLEGRTSSDNEGTAAGKKMSNRKLIFIGGGSAGGALIGAAIGGGKGALIGGLIGAGGGFLGDRYTKGPEAEVKSGTEFGVLLNQSISMPKFAETPDGAYDQPRTEVGSERSYVVQPGDTLSKISIRFYGTSGRYMDIYNANRDRLSSPANISVGQELIIP